MTATRPTSRRGLAIAIWLVLLGLIAVDVWRSYGAHERFNEPPLVAAGSGAVARGGHCAVLPKK